jgi:hypothetical protein
MQNSSWAYVARTGLLYDSVSPAPSVIVATEVHQLLVSTPMKEVAVFLKLRLSSYSEYLFFVATFKG